MDDDELHRRIRNAVTAALLEDGVDPSQVIIRNVSFDDKTGTIELEYDLKE